MTRLAVYGERKWGFMSIFAKWLFAVAYKTHVMKESVLKKIFLNVGQYLFTTFPWSLKGNPEEVVTKFSLNQLEIKIMPTKYQSFWQQILNTMSNVMQIEESRMTLSHLIARFFIALEPSINIPLTLSLPSSKKPSMGYRNSQKTQCLLYS